MIKKLKEFILHHTLYILSYIIPKKKNLYLFLYVKNRDFTGNAGSLIEYISKKHSEINIKIAGKPKFNQHIKNLNFKEVQSGLDYYWTHLRAEYILIDNYVQGRFPYGSFPIIQLWHGVGFKKICLLNEKARKSSREKLKKYFKHYRMIVSTSNEDVIEKNLAFGVNTSVVTGYPRNDIFFTSGNIGYEIKQRLDISNYKRIITYTPTFRNFKSTNKIPFSRGFLSRLNNYLVKNSSVFIIKKHPLDKTNYNVTTFSNIKDFSNKNTDVQKLLLITDLLISDYSSIIMDYAITKRPFICYAYDLQDYKQNNRSLYRQVEDTIPVEALVINEDELLEKIINTNWFLTSDNKEAFDTFSKKFHQFLDGHSSKRVFEAIQNLKNN